MTTPLLLCFYDNDGKNHRLDNLYFLCYNCFYLLKPGGKLLHTPSNVVKLRNKMLEALGPTPLEEQEERVAYKLGDVVQDDKTDLMDKVLLFSEFKMNKASKKTDGTKRNKIRDIPKLDDANWAGTKKSDQCILILTEGDSAKSMAISGLSVVGRDIYGAFPLKGKVMNVRDSSKEQIMKNYEITNMKKIIGLETGNVY